MLISSRIAAKGQAVIAAIACGAMALIAFFAANIAGPEPVRAAPGLDRGVHMGVASCAGSTCHGRNEADGAVVRQDELMRWQEESTPGGAHARAYRVLGEPRGLAIGRKLGIGDPRSAAICLGCHSTPAAQRGPRFQVSDGVGCEACHGAASGWIAGHSATGTSHARNVSQGLVPLDRPTARAGVCLDCHFGSDAPGQFVTHNIMAAGHPRVSFELDLFSKLTQHHNEDADYRQRKGPSNSMQTWAVGQAMALERSLSLYTKPAIANSGVFPEFYFYDCHSCHRRIYDDEDARPTALDNPGRPIPAGMPPYNDENMIMLSAAVRVAAPDLAQRYDSETRAFHAAMAQGREPAVAAAQRLRETAVALADRFAQTAFSREQTFAIMDTIASEAISPRFTDYEGSVQAVMAIDTLLNGLVNRGAVDGGAAAALRVQINQAYAAVAEPNSYRPLEFRRALGGAVRSIRALK